MFSISNAVAYADLMVSGVQPGDSEIGDLLGPSCWFDVRGEGTGEGGKWCQQEGDLVVHLLGRLEALGEAPDVHIITPFRAVQEPTPATMSGDPACCPRLDIERRGSGRVGAQPDRHRSHVPGPRGGGSDLRSRRAPRAAGAGPGDGREGPRTFSTSR